MLEDDSEPSSLENGNGFYELLFNTLADFFYQSASAQDNEGHCLRPFLHCLKTYPMVVGERR